MYKHIGGTKMESMLDKLLALRFAEQFPAKRLNNLEGDVLRRIHQQKTELSLPWYEVLARAFNVPQFRLASLILALVIGVCLSPILPSELAIASTSEMLGLDLFTMNSPQLPTTLIMSLE